MRTLGKWILRIVLALVALIILGLSVAAYIPVKPDVFISDDEAGAGSVAFQPAYSGLQREFPPVNAPVDNPTTPAKVELGRQLFFDPVLSADNDLSCASCHHPDLGFSNGQPTASGRNGVSLPRNAPTLWNVAYSRVLFWDGRESSLESQATVPLTHPDEMAANVETMAAELKAIPAYTGLFEAAFGSGADNITPLTVNQALAAFERTLITNNSPFDRYAAGQVDALTPPQRRGLALFRSGATRCFECHAAPTFASDTFRIVGVPGDDPGRAGVDPAGAVGAFKVPTLRNIALSAPYMHNGSLATLADVVEFYAEGGGRAHGQTNVDPFVSGFDFSEQEKADLVAFLYALTDESQLPPVPEVALSGLPTIRPIVNRERATAQGINSPVGRGVSPGPHQPQRFTVLPGHTIQSVVDRARPGDMILIPYRAEPYFERVVIDISDLTLEGVPNAQGQYPVFDGQNQLSEAVIASGNNFKVGNLEIRNFTDNGILVEGVNNVYIHDMITDNTGTYGVYPTKSTGVLVERVTASGVNDAAIYAGQCRDVVIRDSTAHSSVIGIELENTINGEAYNNHTYNNSLGILVVVLPQLNSKVSRHSVLHDNLIENNNHENFAAPGSAASLAPRGTGILLLGADEADVYGNTIRDNSSTGVALYSLTVAYAVNEIDVGPNPENNWIHNNTYTHNGYDPTEVVRALGIPTGDILWDGAGWDNRFDEPGATGGFPPVLPGSAWPTPVARSFWHAFQLIVKLAS